MFGVGIAACSVPAGRWRGSGTGLMVMHVFKFGQIDLAAGCRQINA